MNDDNKFEPVKPQPDGELKKKVLNKRSSSSSIANLIMPPL